MSAEITKAGGALAIRADQTAWTPEQAAVLQQSGIDNEVTSAELSSFLHLCQRTQLDPFSRQIYLIGRYDRKAGRKVFTPQTSIDGYRVTAHRAASKAGHALGYEDTLWCDESGQWRDVWLSDKPPAAAKVVVVRNGQRFPAVAKYAEYVQRGKEDKPIGLWGKMPATMTAKCAEALALRMAFPHDLAGVYTAEEMAQADNPAPERHLRKVQPGEGDPWATPPEDARTPAMHGRSQPAQDIADVAAQTSNRAAVQGLYRQANTDGLLAETVKVDRELLELGAYLIARGQQLSTPPPPTGDEPSEDGVVDVDAVDVPEDDEHAAAVAELRAFAAENGIPDIDAAAYPHLGAPLDDVAPAAIRALTAQLRVSAA
ncbi:phage recombination protein Bet [Streptomyces sp. PKU-MA01144]|uniref:phage recombination protein Bet n=1 Tax=Streptomyces sp. PKU-MA01144 TaxID=2729138 RepID=UPI00147BE878|nr:phage recombination protein Bet [Streptomyces sp. PKU-MA01144]NNJ04187.1 phage recombination protein Bet [Streptomyces sp. PKU-MA01144]